MTPARDPVAVAEGAFDKALLLGCFGESKISGSDVDLFTNVNQHLGFIELKPPGFRWDAKDNYAKEKAMRDICFPKTITSIVALGTDNGRNIEEVMVRNSIEGLLNGGFIPADLDYVRQIMKEIATRGLGEPC